MVRSRRKIRLVWRCLDGSATHLLVVTLHDGLELTLLDSSGPEFFKSVADEEGTESPNGFAFIAATTLVNFLQLEAHGLLLGNSNCPADSGPTSIANSRTSA